MGAGHCLREGQLRRCPQKSSRGRVALQLPLCRLTMLSPTEAACGRCRPRTKGALANSSRFSRRSGETRRTSASSSTKRKPKFKSCRESGNLEGSRSEHWFLAFQVRCSCCGNIRRSSTWLTMAEFGLRSKVAGEHNQRQCLNQQLRHRSQASVFLHKRQHRTQHRVLQRLGPMQPVPRLMQLSRPAPPARTHGETWACPLARDSHPRIAAHPRCRRRPLQYLLQHRSGPGYAVLRRQCWPVLQQFRQRGLQRRKCLRQRCLC